MKDVVDFWKACALGCVAVLPVALVVFALVLLAVRFVVPLALGIPAPGELGR